MREAEEEGVAVACKRVRAGLHAPWWLPAAGCLLRGLAGWMDAPSRC